MIDVQPGRRSVSREIGDAMRAARASGASYRAIAREFGFDTRTAFRQCNREPGETKPEKVAKSLKPRPVIVLTVAVPRVVAPRMSVPFTSDFGADIARLSTRADLLETGDESSRARAALCRELARGLENAQARGAILAGRRRAMRQTARSNDFYIGGGIAA